MPDDHPVPVRIAPPPFRLSHAGSFPGADLFEELQISDEVVISIDFGFSDRPQREEAGHLVIDPAAIRTSMRLIFSCCFSLRGGFLYKVV